MPSWMKGRRWMGWLAGALLAAVAMTAGVVAVALHRAEPFLRTHIVAALENRFHARVELDNFHVSLMNGLWAEGKGLRIWPPAQMGGLAVPAGQSEPLIRLEQFRFHTSLSYRPGAPIHIAVVELKGLTVHLPPRQRFLHTGAPAMPHSAGLVRFDVETMECDGTQLVLETDKPGKLPLDFAIAHLTLTHIAAGGAVGFTAELTNPRPVGTIHTMGSFGPWSSIDPGESPLKGDYRFEHADLGGFKGIAGILDSTGHFEGTLRDLVVDGETQTKDFRLTHFGAALPLTTRFHAKVDGTNGDTWLEPVDATLGRSHFTAHGQIVRVPTPTEGAPHATGHDIALDVDVDRARIEDFLRLASKSGNPLLTGDVHVKARLHIPPGTVPIHERMTLDGRFRLDQAEFTSDKIQKRIAELSLRGQGKPEELKTANAASIQSSMQGTFHLAGAVLALPELGYTVPGAEIKLHGTYGLDGGTLDFEGVARMQATVSKMLGGWKGLLLKPADRLFRKDGAGTQVPIHIEGTRESPKFGIGSGEKKLQGPAAPEE